MEKTGPTVCQESESIAFVYFSCIRQIHFFLRFLSLSGSICPVVCVCFFMYFCVFSNGSHSRRGGSHCAQGTESFYISNLHW